MRTGGHKLGQMEVCLTPFIWGAGHNKDALMSLNLFALAFEPLAILLRADRGVRRIMVGPLEEKLSLYAGDTLLYLADA